MLPKFQGSVVELAQAALILELRTDGTYKILKNKYGGSEPINQLVLVQEDGLVREILNG